MTNEPLEFCSTQDYHLSLKVVPTFCFISRKLRQFIDPDDRYHIFSVIQAELFVLAGIKARVKIKEVRFLSL